MIFVKVKRHPFYKKRIQPVVRRVIGNALFVRHFVREGLWRVATGMNGRVTAPQAVKTWRVDWPQMASSAELSVWLRAQGVQSHEGSHALYLPPQPALAALIPEIVGLYPADTGFKILKDFRHPNEAHYLTGRAGTMTIRTNLTGTPAEQIVAANYLHAAGLGPRVWDLACWASPSNQYSVFVVEHIPGAAPSDHDCRAFMARLAELSQGDLLRVLLPGWENHPDFACPDCTANLRTKTDGTPQYVDFQNFRLTSSEGWIRHVIAHGASTLHFGAGRIGRGEGYVYQSIPGVTASGKRNMVKRWDQMLRIWERAGVSVDGRVALDVGCNSGMMLNFALSQGAEWGLGWDRPGVVASAHELLWALGSSRFNLFGRELARDYRIERDIPPHLAARLGTSLVFYLSIRQHIDFLDSLTEMPWQVLVYEGHQGEYVRDLKEVLRPLLLQGVRIATTEKIGDGDSGERPLAILVRD